MKSITIEGQLRTGFGKSATRQLRSQELVPGVIYGGAEEINFQAPAAALRTLVYTPSFQIAEVTLDNKTYRTIEVPWVVHRLCRSSRATPSGIAVGYDITAAGTVCLECTGTIAVTGQSSSRHIKGYTISGTRRYRKC